MELAANADVVDQLEVYLSGTGNVIPKEGINEFLAAAGCHATNWDEMDIDLVGGWQDMGEGRLQGNLF
jgi:hypothetical protein